MYLLCALPCPCVFIYNWFFSVSCGSHSCWPHFISLECHWLCMLKNKAVLLLGSSLVIQESFKCDKNNSILTLPSFSVQKIATSVKYWPLLVANFYHRKSWKPSSWRRDNGIEQWLKLESYTHETEGLMTLPNMPLLTFQLSNEHVHVPCAKIVTWFTSLVQKKTSLDKLWTLTHCSIYILSLTSFWKIQFLALLSFFLIHSSWSNIHAILDDFLCFLYGHKGHIC